MGGRPGGVGWVQCLATRRRCQRSRVSGVTIQPSRRRRGSAAAIAPSRLRSSSVSSGRSIWRRNTASWWPSTTISRSFERPERSARRASAPRNRYKMQHATLQHRPASSQVNPHDRVFGTHRPWKRPDDRRSTRASRTSSNTRSASASRPCVTTSRPSERVSNSSPCSMTTSAGCPSVSEENQRHDAGAPTSAL